MSSPEPVRHLHTAQQYEGGPEAEWDRRALEHRARADLAAAQQASEQLRQQRHDDHMAEGRRYLERLQLDQAITAAEVGRFGAARPALYREHLDLEAPLEVVQEPRGRHQVEVDEDLDERARALFARLPDAGRPTVQRELGIDEGPARRLVERRKAGQL